MDLTKLLREMEEDLPMIDSPEGVDVDEVDPEEYENEEFAVNGKILIKDYSPTTSRVILLPNARRQIMRVDFKEVRKQLKDMNVSVTSTQVAKVFKETLKHLGLVEGEE